MSKIHKCHVNKGLKAFTKFHSLTKNYAFSQKCLCIWILCIMRYKDKPSLLLIDRTILFYHWTVTGLLCLFSVIFLLFGFTCCCWSCVFSRFCAFLQVTKLWCQISRRATRTWCSRPIRRCTAIWVIRCKAWWSSIRQRRLIRWTLHSGSM